MSSISQSFGDFKNDFYSRVNDFELFNCSEFNLLKVVLDGLHVNYISKGNIRTPLFYPSLGLKIFYFLKGLQNKNSIFFKKTSASVFIYNVARAIETQEGDFFDFRYQNILKAYGKENCTFVIDKPNDQLTYDYDFNSLKANISYQRLSKEDLELRQNLLQAFKRIKKAHIFSLNELKNIKIAIQQFFDQYRVFYYLLKLGNYKVAHFDGHYHREGLMLALQRNGVKRMELQHGLIAPEDIFYVFPKQIDSVVSRALFPDKMLVYSSYWKNILLQGAEWKEHQIEVIGDYHFKTDLKTEEAKKLLMILPMFS